MCAPVPMTGSVTIVQPLNVLDAPKLASMITSSLEKA